jgi:YcxB-like protein
MIKEITLEYNPSIDELIKASYYPIFNNWKIRFFFGITLLALGYNILYPLFEKENFEVLDFLPLIILPIFLYFGSKRIFNISKKKLANNPKLNEKRQVFINNESLINTGESFKVKYLWNEFSKIEETPKWFLLYIGDYRVFPIIKNDLKENQYSELKELFNSIDIKKSLK